MMLTARSDLQTPPPNRRSRHEIHRVHDSGHPENVTEMKQPNKIGKPGPEECFDSGNPAKKRSASRAIWPEICGVNRAARGRPRVRSKGPTGAPTIKAVWLEANSHARHPREENCDSTRTARKIPSPPSREYFLVIRGRRVDRRSHVKRERQAKGKNNETMTQQLHKETKEHTGRHGRRL